jgi:hypothetical protein
VRFFFDNNLAPAYVDALRLLSSREFTADELCHLTQKYRPDAADEVWLPSLAKEGDWIIISGDPRISRSPREQAAWLSAGLTTFFLAKGWMDRPFWLQAVSLIRFWPEIRQTADTAGGGTGFLVRVNGKIDRLPPAQTRR